ncbi:MAG: hypothetical protein HRU15_04740 [Planctomycetes bacterium]|nr:hypothetical protein [Planctomycetota bacterium]
MSAYHRTGNRAAFTLIEIAMSIGILTFGITAVIAVYLTALKWAEEIRVDLTAMHSGKACLFDASLLFDGSNSPARNDDAIASGWVNDYFIYRTVDTGNAINIINNGGKFSEVTVQVYYGGNNTDGRLIHSITVPQILPSTY